LTAYFSFNILWKREERSGNVPLRFFILLSFMDEKKLRRDALEIFQSGLEAVNPQKAIIRNLIFEVGKLKVGEKTYDLEDYKQIFIFGAGKASAAMAQPLEEILMERIKGGLINVKYGHVLPLKKIEINEAGHPLPDEAGFRGAKKMVEMLKKTGERDLVFFLISGGGSALLPYPQEGVSLDDKKKVTQILLEAGATIAEINIVRKHISKLKGGRLAKIVFPSSLISLILSDVVDDKLDTIASGPTVPDESTFKDCLEIAQRYGVWEKFPVGVRRLIEKGLSGLVDETPKEDDPAFKKVQNVIIARNRDAVESARRKAEELGYNAMIISTSVEGEAKEVAKVHVAIAKEILSSGNPLKRPACVISGGETTVTIRGKGLGGRNQEFALEAAIGIEGYPGVLILSCGTDGTDGPTDAAGAMVDGMSVRRAKELGLEARKYLRENDSYHFFKRLGDLIFTGPTFTNVMDLRLVLVG